VNLDAWLSKIESMHPHAIEMGLSRMHIVAHRGDVLTFSCPIITVAGTNGKGSTVYALAHLLRKAGLSVATYTSPHLVRFNERIHINGSLVSDEALCAAFERADHAREQVPLTFFEFTTLAALMLFKSLALDVILLEVGLGGRLDAVNVVAPSLAIITTIGLDHQAWLGDTPEAIATEKAGILRSGIPVVLGQSAQLPVIMNETLRLRNSVWCEGKDFHITNNQHWHFNNDYYALPQNHLPINSVSLALAAYAVLQKQGVLPLPALTTAINTLYQKAMPGRFQILEQKAKAITLLLDVAHNAPASHWLAERLVPYKKKGRRIIALWSSLSDKDLAGIITPLKAYIDSWHVAEIDDIRGTPVHALVAHLQAQGIEAISPSGSIMLAWQILMRRILPGDCVLVFGSFMTVGTILSCIERDKSELWVN